MDQIACLWFLQKKERRVQSCNYWKNTKNSSTHKVTSCGAWRVTLNSWSILINLFNLSVRWALLSMAGSSSLVALSYGVRLGVCFTALLVSQIMNFSMWRVSANRLMTSGLSAICLQIWGQFLFRISSGVDESTFIILKSKQQKRIKVKSITFIHIQCTSTIVFLWSDQEIYERF